MAEGFARAYGDKKVEALSAGTEPKGLNPFAVEVMKEKSIDISHHRSKAFSEELGRTMDCVVTVCGDAEERCPLLPPGVKRLHWPLPDPAKAAGSRGELLAVFRRSRDEIEERVKTLLGDVLA